MNLFQAILLGIVQGLTEFLPVSSSGHLVLLQKIFGINNSSLLFEVLLHIGTLVAVFIVLWKDILAILKKLIQPLTLYIIIGTIPAVIAALLFGDTIDMIFDTGKFLGFCFLATTVLLVIAEILSKRALASNSLKKQENMNWIDALLIGIMQAVAIAPGISRSGATISGALFRKLDRDLAARFSFLLSIPAILGALVLHLKDLFELGSAQSSSPESLSVVSIIAGTVTSGIVGFFAVKFMLKIIREKSLYGFAIYTGVLGILVLIDQYITHIVF
jgi:undecaprenyl-diphosphatase